MKMVKIMNNAELNPFALFAKEGGPAGPGVY